MIYPHFVSVSQALIPTATAAVAILLIPRHEGMVPLPSLVGKIRLGGLVEIVARLLEVEQCHVVVGHLAGDHPSAEFGLACFFLFAFDGSGGERWLGRMGLVLGDENCAAGEEEVV